MSVSLGIYRGRGSDDVGNSAERGELPLRPAGVPGPGDTPSWRGSPRNTMILPVCGAVMLMCFGVLLGTAWTTQLLQPRLRRQAEEQRKLNEEWLALRAVRRGRATCPHCGYAPPQPG
ncbi:MAG TPA: hypothetical protein VFO16_16720 [Pseudonocardiaceae bacterium]|nr:hypothetical protein [Pseudonocardiaceae bacterium]